MKPVLTLTLAFLCLCSCSTYEPIVKKREKLKYDAVLVHPGWKYEDPKGKKWIVPLTLAVVGGAYGYNTEVKYGEKSYSGSENAAILAGGGLLVGAIANGLIFPRKKKEFDISHSEEWLASYRKKTGEHYILQSADKETGTLVLSPGKVVEKIRNEYEELVADITSTTPRSDFYTLKVWRKRLDEEYSILPPDEIAQMRRTIDAHREKIADAELRVWASEMENLDNTYLTLAELSRIQKESKVVYYESSHQAKSGFNEVLDKKTNAVLLHELDSARAEINGWAYRMEDLQKLNAYVSTFKSQYGAYKDHEQVNSMYTFLDQKLKQLTAQNREKLEKNLDLITDRFQLNEFEKKYGAASIDEFPNAGELSSLISQKRIELIAQEEEKREAREQLITLLLPPFHTKGLSYKRIFEYLYRGNFEKIPFDREDIEFSNLLNAYIVGYSRACSTYLPPDKKAITYRVCARESVRKNLLGVELSRYCVRWENRPTGDYASPEMYAARTKIRGLQSADFFNNFFKMLAHPNPLGKMMEGVQDVQKLQSDVAMILSMNGCESETTSRLEENLRRFAYNEQPLTAFGDRPGIVNLTSKNQNLEKLINDLIMSESADWLMYKYEAGSVSDVTVLVQDEHNRPSEVSASYYYGASGNRNLGFVRITFDEGVPSCLYFSNVPRICRTADRTIAAEYVRGAYRR